MDKSDYKNKGAGNCQVCTGCGRCGKVSGAYSSIKVSVEMSVEPDACKREILEGEKGYIAAVDIGTTTVAMQLRRVSDAGEADRYSGVNPQRKFGMDVLSRILAAEDAGQAEQMRHLILQVLEEGIRQFQRTIEKRNEPGHDIRLISIAANTTMVYLLMGYPAGELGRSPFHASFLQEIRDNILGIPMLVLPGISAFVGGDILAGIYALGMEQRNEKTLLIDLGTNGEMVLGCRGKLLCVSTAAGPAFEGNGEEGSFASDRVALTARLLGEGILDETGLLSDTYFDEGVVIEGILITQPVIRGMQMAKGAVCAGILLLCREYGISPKDIETVYLAGGFGRYLSVDAAGDIGLIPRELKECTKAVGNTALEGSFVYGRDRICGKLSTQWSPKQVVSLNLATLPGFEQLFLNCMNLKP